MVCFIAAFLSLRSAFILLALSTFRRRHVEGIEKLHGGSGIRVE